MNPDAMIGVCEIDRLGTETVWDTAVKIKTELFLQKMAMNGET